MEARLSAVQKRLVLLWFASLAVAILARPQPDNGRFTAALDELVSFRSQFVRRDAEQALRAQAEAGSQLSLKAVLSEQAQRRGPRLRLAEQTPALRPLSGVRLATLADVSDHARPGATLAVGSPSVEALGASLAWRLSRTQKSGPFTLASVQLLPAEVSAEDVALEAQVGVLRLASLAARAAVDDATRKVATAERRVEKRAKRKSRSLEKMQIALDAARLVLDEKSARHTLAQQAYEDAARRAERAFVSTPQGAGAPERALARVTMELAGERSTLDIPVQLSLLQLPVAPLSGAGFPALRAAGLWDEVKGLSPEAAISAIRGRFNWHFNHVELLGLKLSGSRLLQLLPCVLPLILAVLLLHMRSAEACYSPFSTRVPDSLPRVGLKSRFLEFVAIVLLPLAAIASAAASLLLIGQPPVLPALTAVAGLPLAALVFAKLSDLREQTVSIVKSHSFPPPAA